MRSAPRRAEGNEEVDTIAASGTCNRNDGRNERLIRSDEVAMTQQSNLYADTEVAPPT